MSQAVRFWIRAPHLSAAGTAIVLAALALWILFGTFHLENRLTHLAAPAMLEVKDQGLALQDEAFGDRDLLPIYGSSEFRNDSPYSGRMFFSHYPTGFGLFIVGKAGAKTLIIAQRIGALGNRVRGRKVAIVLSPTWFLAQKEGRSFYEGNFSALQAEELIFNSPLSPGLKRDLAREMLKYPETLENHHLLDFELHRLAAKDDTLEDRLVRGLGRSVDDVLQVVDRYETTFALASEILHDPAGLATGHRHPKQRPAWNDLTRAAAASSPTSDPFGSSPAEVAQAAKKLGAKLRGRGQPSFEAMLNQSDEWAHLDLLLRTFRELGAKPFIISQPINATAFRGAGVKPAEIAYYYARLRNELREYGYPFATCEQYEHDPRFFSDDLGHPSAKGWMLLNRLIDQFYHDKLPASLD
jgi:D-alanine transfer protein